jgi:hypothetical protein
VSDDGDVANLPRLVGHASSWASLAGSGTILVEGGSPAARGSHSSSS